MGIIHPRFDGTRVALLAANDLDPTVTFDVRLGRPSTHNNIAYMGIEIEFVDTITSGTTDDHIDISILSLADGTNPSSVESALHVYESWIAVGEITARRSIILSSVNLSWDPWASSPIHVPPVGWAFRVSIAKDTGDRTHSMVVTGRFFNLAEVLG